MNFLRLKNSILYLFLQEKLKHISTKYLYKNVQSSKYFQKPRSFLAVYIQMNNFKMYINTMNTSLQLKLAYNSYPQHNGLNEKKNSTKNKKKRFMQRDNLCVLIYINFKKRPNKFVMIKIRSDISCCKSIDWKGI